MIKEKFSYLNKLSSGLTIQNIEPEFAQGLEDLQRIVFPSLADDELILKEHYLHHFKIFPEGQFVITDGEKIVGMTTTMRCNFDFNHQNHTFKETIAGGWMTNHDPNGEWLYGLDVGVHPDYRGKGLARELYRARQILVNFMDLKGQLTVGMMNGYGKLNNQITGIQYYNELIKGERSDPTISAQFKIGFKPLALIENYVNDPSCGNFGILLQLDKNTII